MNFEAVIDEMRGYLVALRELVHTDTVLWVSSKPVTKDFETTIQEHIDELSPEFSCAGQTPIGYREIHSLFSSLLFDRMQFREQGSTIRRLDWRLFEYYGLASTAQSDDYPFNPIVSEESVRLSLTAIDYEIDLHVVTPVGKYLVATTIGKTRQSDDASMSNL